jgi:hypothetical protein
VKLGEWGRSSSSLCTTRVKLRGKIANKHRVIFLCHKDFKKRKSGDVGRRLRGFLLKFFHTPKPHASASRAKEDLGWDKTTPV